MSRYRRQDEVGTPYCVTVDFDSLEDESVTVPAAMLLLVFTSL